MIKEALHLQSVQAVYKWQDPKNKSLPSIDNLIGLMDILDCQFQDIFVIEEI